MISFRIQSVEEISIFLHIQQSEYHPDNILTHVNRPQLKDIVYRQIPRFNSHF